MVSVARKDIYELAVPLCGTCAPGDGIRHRPGKCICEWMIAFGNEYPIYIFSHFLMFGLYGANNSKLLFWHFGHFILAPHAEHL